MEINFQQQQKLKTPSKTTKTKARKSSSSSNNKFVGVRQRPSGRWVAEIKDTTKKIRMWLGTFKTAEEAARAYDQAACLLRGSNTRTNFATQVSPSSPLASRIMNLLNSKKSATAKNVIKSQIQASRQDLDASVAGSDDTSYCCCSTLTCANGPACRSPDTSTNILDPSSPAADDKMMQDSSQLLDNDDGGGGGGDVYRPDMSDCIMSSMGELDCKGSSTGTAAWDYDRFSLVAPELLDFPPKSTGMELSSEFERIKVERQISASLYAIHGLHEYMEAVYDPITDEALLWDLPLHCSLSS